MLMYGVLINVFGINKHHRTLLLYSWFPTVKSFLTYRSFRRPVSSEHLRLLGLVWNILEYRVTHIGFF